PRCCHPRDSVTPTMLSSPRCCHPREGGGLLHLLDSRLRGNERLYRNERLYGNVVSPAKAGVSL
ncbi:MAG: hypothetical protein OXM55_04515, partial [Bdellovibrionales bacterium]|nr:hypothetical protein [Bdellovibrionales bacterium]